MTRFTRLLAAATLALTAVACGGGGGTPADQLAEPGRTRVTLTLNWVPYGEHAPFYYGLKKGIFARAGIDLVIRPGSGSGNTIQQVAQRKTDFGWADTPPLLKGVAAGMKIKSVGVYLQKGPSAIEFFADKHIRSPADLRGKSVGGTPGDTLYATFPAWLKANGVDQADVRVVSVDPAGKISALATGEVDAIMGFFHDQAPTIENRTGRKVSYLLFTDWGMNLLGTGLVAHDEMLADNPDLVRRFVRATQQAWTEAAKDIPGAADAMAELATDEPPKQVLVEQLTLAVSLLATGRADTPGVDSEAKWTETIGLMAEHGGLRAPGPAKRYWDPSYAAGS